MSRVMIVGGERSGEYVKWFGNRVRIQGVKHTLYRVIFTEGSMRQYYVKDGTAWLGPREDIDRIEMMV